MRKVGRCIATPVTSMLFVARAALASPDYPAHLRSTLALGYEPACTLCHASNDGGQPLEPFGESLVARGLVAKDTGSLDRAIARMRADDVDSDGDGATDLDELAWGGDPSHADLPLEPTVAPPRYGCAIHRKNGPLRVSDVIELGALGAALSRLRRRNPTTRP